MSRLPAPREGRSAGPLVWSDAADWHLGCACLLCTTFHSGEEFGLLDGWWRHSLTKPCLLSGTLAAPDDSPKEALPSRLSQLSLPSSPFPTPGLRPILGHLLTHSLLTSQRCSAH